jgi:hypothetical protein
VGFWLPISYELIIKNIKRKFKMTKKKNILYTSRRSMFLYKFQEEKYISFFMVCVEKKSVNNHVGASKLVFQNGEHKNIIIS